MPRLNRFDLQVLRHLSRTNFALLPLLLSGREVHLSESKESKDPEKSPQPHPPAAASPKARVVGLQGPEVQRAQERRRGCSVHGLLVSSRGGRGGSVLGEQLCN